jgi:hypothetical protein
VLSALLVFVWLHAGSPASQTHGKEASSAPIAKPFLRYMSGLTWTIAPAAGFDRYAGLWDEIYSAGGQVPVLDSRFVAIALAVFGMGKESIVIGSANGLALAIGIFYKTNLGTWQTFQPSQAPLGPWISRGNLTSEELLASLASALPGLVLGIGLTQQDPDLSPRPANGNLIHTLDYIDTARIWIDRPFSEYWLSRDKKVRYEVGRRLRRLSEQGITPRLECVLDPRHMPEAVADFGRLESSGWKGREGTAVAVDNEQGRFYSILLERFAKRGEAKVYRYWFGDRLVATQLCIEAAGTAAMLKTTYDEKFKSFAPGILMRTAMFEQMFATPGLRRIEFLGKVLEWHEDWCSDVRRLFHVNYLPRPLLHKGLRTLSRTLPSAANST